MTFDQWLPLLQPKFPQLTAANSRLTSPADEEYNCIAWAAENSDRWWWPDGQQQFYWPPSVSRVETLAAFVEAYGTLGYRERTGAALEVGKQKVAIYASPQGKPTHAARQRPDGWWASKLGQIIDIEHVLSAVEGPIYGAVAVVLARSL
ncbi:MAG: DUF7689 domain-containing protein [Pirellulaceae bacterium]